MLAMVSQIAARMTRYGTRLRRGEGVVPLVIGGPQRTRGGTLPCPRSLPAVGRFSPYPFRPSARCLLRPPPFGLDPLPTSARRGGGAGPREKVRPPARAGARSAPNLGPKGRRARAGGASARRAGGAG